MKCCQFVNHEVVWQFVHDLPIDYAAMPAIMHVSSSGRIGESQVWNEGDKKNTGGKLVARVSQ